jgi:uncharacterized protein YaaN involved in tellurite resistance
VDIRALDHLTDEEVRKARDLAAEIDLSSSMAVTNFAVQPQKALDRITDPLLEKVTTHDTGPVGETLADLLERVRSLDPSLLGHTEGWLVQLPFVGDMFSKTRKFIARYEKISSKIDQIVVRLYKAQDTLVRDITTLDVMYEEDRDYFRALLVYIAAGEIKLEELRQQHERIAAEASRSSNQELAQQAADMSDTISRMERRVYDLKTTAVIALQTGPQIRLVQGGNQALVEKIQQSILTTIPLWKQQVIIAIGIYNQKRAMELARAVTDTTNQLLLQNATMLRAGVTAAARESQRAVAEVETLQQVNDNLIATIEETLEIVEEGRRNRLEGERQLEAIQEQLRAKLAEIRPAAS